MKTEEVQQRFRNAVRILADEPGVITERLMIAFISQLAYIDPHKDLPDSLVSDFMDLKFKLVADQVEGDRGTVSRAIQTIDNEEASQIAGEIVDMFLTLHDLPTHIWDTKRATI